VTNSSSSKAASRLQLHPLSELRCCWLQARGGARWKPDSRTQRCWAAAPDQQQQQLQLRRLPNQVQQVLRRIQRRKHIRPNSCRQQCAKGQLCQAVLSERSMVFRFLQALGLRQTVMGMISKGCKGLGGLPYTENRENNQSAFRLPSG
jgi:hypothetical protein